MTSWQYSSFPATIGHNTDNFLRHQKSSCIGNIVTWKSDFGCLAFHRRHPFWTVLKLSVIFTPGTGRKHAALIARWWSGRNVTSLIDSPIYRFPIPVNCWGFRSSSDSLRIFQWRLRRHRFQWNFSFKSNRFVSFHDYRNSENRTAGEYCR